MKIKWYGHSCFMLTSDSGVRILTDPCDPSTGYDISGVEADAVTVSHDHHDHNYLDAVKGDPVVIRDEKPTEVCDIKVQGVCTYHDDCGGKKRGKNIVFIFEIDGLRIIHAGDLGDISDPDLAKRIGKCDVLLVPIGGVYTIDAPQARAFANMLHAKVVIPMHYKTDALTFELGDVDTFVDHAVDCSIHRLKKSEAVLDKSCLGSDRILLLSYKD
ncbi:MAG: MBL fold metallo-hydrolase [Clostridia bacterium]|nr:MBL fold metallo-hydrolase [Clostridia bacterium]